MRRIVQYPSTTQYSEVKISPQWHQWLRHTRTDPPSLTEQSQDLVRQRNLKVLAAQADARWAAKPSFLDAPDRSQPIPALELKDQGGYTQTAESPDKKGVRSAIGGGLEDIPQSAEETLKPVKEAKTSEVERKHQEGLGQKNKRRQEQPKPVAEPGDDPWKQARGGPSEGWQPKAWDGNIAAARR